VLDLGTAIVAANTLNGRDAENAVICEKIVQARNVRRP